MNAIVIPTELAPDPINLDPRPCELCGLTVDRHDMVDHGEGPEFFCADLSPDEMTLGELERRAELRREEDTAAILARWEMLDPPDPLPNRDAESYRTPQSTIDTFWFVARLDNSAHLKRWLAEHPRDVENLKKLWEAKHAGA